MAGEAFCAYPVSVEATASASARQLVPAYLLFISVVFLQRFAITINGYPVQWVTLICVATIGYLVVSRRAYVDKGRLLLYLITASVLSAIYIDQGSATELHPRITSFLLLLSIYVLYVVRLDLLEAEYEDYVEVYQKLMFLAALAGIAQYILQYWISNPALFSFYDVLPNRWLIQGYHTAIPVKFGSQYHKANGLLMLEPSTFSQFLAIAIMVEMTNRRNRLRLAAYSVAIFLAFSGTGLIILAIFLTYLLIKQGKARYIALIVGMLGLIYLFGDDLGANVYVARASSNTVVGSSGFDRFIGPVFLAEQFGLRDTKMFLFGGGAGTVYDYIAQAKYPSHDPAWVKLFIEYGALGMLTFLGFLSYALFARTHSRTLSAALLVKYLFLSGTLLSQHGNILAIALLSLPSRGAMTRVGEKTGTGTAVV